MVGGGGVYGWKGGGYMVVFEIWGGIWFGGGVYGRSEKWNATLERMDSNLDQIRAASGRAPAGFI